MTPLEHLPGVGPATARLLAKALNVETCEALSKLKDIENTVLQSDAFTKASKRMQSTVRRVNLQNLAELAKNSDAPSTDEPLRKKAKTSAKSAKKKKAPVARKPPAKLQTKTPEIQVEFFDDQDTLAFGDFQKKLYDAADEAALAEGAEVAADDEWLLLRVGWKAPEMLFLHRVLTTEQIELNFEDAEVKEATQLMRRIISNNRTYGLNKFNTKVNLLMSEQMLLQELLPSEVFRLKKRTVTDDLVLTLRSVAHHVSDDVLRLIAQFACSEPRSVDSYASISDEITKLYRQEKKVVEKLNESREEEEEAPMYYQYPKESNVKCVSLIRAVSRFFLTVSDGWRLSNGSGNLGQLAANSKLETLYAAAGNKNEEPLNPVEMTPISGTYDISVNHRAFVNFAKRLKILHRGSEKLRQQCTTFDEVVGRIDKCQSIIRNIEPTTTEGDVRSLEFHEEWPVGRRFLNFRCFEDPLNLSISEVKKLPNLSFDVSDAVNAVVFEKLPLFVHNTQVFHDRKLHECDLSSQAYRDAVEELVEWMGGYPEGDTPLIYNLPTVPSLAEVLRMLREYLPADDSLGMQEVGDVAALFADTGGRFCNSTNSNCLLSACAYRSFSQRWSLSNRSGMWFRPQLQADFVENHAHTQLVRLTGGFRGVDSLFNSRNDWYGTNGLPQFHIDTRDTHQLKHRKALAKLVCTATLRILLGVQGKIDYRALVQRFLMRDILARLDTNRECQQLGNAEPILRETEMMHNLAAYVGYKQLHVTEIESLWPLAPEDDSIRPALDHVGDVERVPLLRRTSSMLGDKKHALSDSDAARLKQQFPENWNFFDYQRGNIVAMLERERKGEVDVNLLSMLSPLPGRLRLPRVDALAVDVRGHSGKFLGFFCDASSGLLFAVQPQHEAFALRMQLPGGVLADQVGLGKTAQLLAVCCANDTDLFRRNGGKMTDDVDEESEDADLPVAARRIYDSTTKRTAVTMEKLRIVATKHEDNVTFRRLRSDATLVLCPAHLCEQWATECRRLVADCKEREDAVVVCAKPRSHGKIKGFAMVRARFVIVSFEALDDLYVRSGGHVATELLNLLPLNEPTLMARQGGKVPPGFHCSVDDVGTARLRKSSALLPHNVHWRRIIMDECHEFLSDTALETWMSTGGPKRRRQRQDESAFVVWAINALHADYRWTATGTPGACMQYTVLPLLNLLGARVDNKELYNYDRHLTENMKRGVYMSDVTKVSPLWHRVDLRIATYMSYNVARNALRRHTQWTAKSECFMPDFDELEERFDVTPLERILVDSASSVPATVRMIQHSLVDQSSVHLPSGHSLSTMFADLPLENSGDLTRQEMSSFHANPLPFRQVLRERIECMREFLRKSIKDGKNGSVPVARTTRLLARLLQSDSEDPKVVMKLRYDVDKLVPDEHNMKFGSTKLTRIAMHVDSVLCAKASHRVIIFSTMRPFMRLLQHALASLGHTVAVVMYSYSQRQRALKAFREGVEKVRDASEEDAQSVASKYPRVLILNVESAASGLDILGVSHVVLADVMFGRSPRAVQAQETQAVARALRQSRDESMKHRRLQVTRFLAKGTVECTHYDEMVAELQSD